MTDIFCLLQLPNAGDDLQAIKKGIMEIADLIVINKADIDAGAATRAKSQIKTALHMLRPASPNWTVPVLTLSALHKQGIADFWGGVRLPRGRSAPPASSPPNVATRPGLDVGDDRFRAAQPFPQPSRACARICRPSRARSRRAHHARGRGLPAARPPRTIQGTELPRPPAVAKPEI
jgi:hypothetical protein